jgi:C-terminal peptidase prc
MKINRALLFFVILCANSAIAFAENSGTPTTTSAQNLTPEEKTHQEYIDFFAKVYDTMEKNYYYPVSKPAYEKFVAAFDKKIYANLKSSGKSTDYIRWRSAAYLVEALKSPEDIFSAFMPPKSADKYQKDALGKKIDLGIEGTLVADGYRVDKIEIRSDAYEKGLRAQDIIQKIDGIDVVTLKADEISNRLTPLENAKVVLVYRDGVKNEQHTLEAISKEYFKQDVYMIPVDVPGVYCLQIKHFNQMTGPDLGRLMQEIMVHDDSSLIIDLRGNPGGPPLAAREIAAFFLTPEEEFTFFKWKNRPNASLDVPRIPEQYRYHGDIAILVNKESGSASELFSGIMQWRKRATIIGSNTAGQVFLKSMFNFDDKSMVLLVTARGHRPDGEVFSFDGVVPNVPAPSPEDKSSDDMVHFAAQYLVEQKNKTRP